MWGFTVGVRALGVKSLGIFAFGSAAILGNAWLMGAEPRSISGRELFVHEWTERDPLARGGDGLGPMFNERSCVACHFQGGVGGSGPAEKNAQLLTVTPTRTFRGAPPTAGTAAAESARKAAAQQLEAHRLELAKIHPAFGNTPSILYHRASTRPAYLDIRAMFVEGQTMLSDPNSDETGIPRVDSFISNTKLSKDQHQELVRVKDSSKQAGRLVALRGGGTISLLISERNTPALFGAGLLDSIPDNLLLGAANKRYPGYPEITGRVSWLKDQPRFGRFGWKAQKSSLDGFVRGACAAELGVNVRGEQQSGDPTNPTYRAPGLDLSDQECSTMVSYVARLPAPREIAVPSAEKRTGTPPGKTHFIKIGCANCHTPDGGNVKGVYSDLLLHDMGSQMLSTGEYYGMFLPTATPSPFANNKSALNFTGQIVSQFTMLKTNIEGALPNEWRTPPLWGVADSAPYLHDGRAETLEQAIAWHSGESIRTARKYFKLKPKERKDLIDFLRTLRAPPSEGPVAESFVTR